MNTEKLMVKPGAKLKLADRDPEDTHGFDKDEATRELDKLRASLDNLQELLYAERKRALLIVLQGLDASGKDGTIRHVMSGVNPQSCNVTAFKAPTAEELAHDFLWRAHKPAPVKGNIGIFNRSHYEDVLVVRVHNLVPKSVWSKRYDQINDFEAILAKNDTKILKFYLHISKGEQKERLQQRLLDPTKQWKVNPADFEERKHWDDYMAAYEDALSKCTTEDAPWYVIPANKKWFRNLAISQIIVETLENFKMKYPTLTFDPAKIVIN